MRTILFALSVLLAAAIADAKPALGSLPCKGSGAFFPVSPVDLSRVSAIKPLGNLNPPGHTIPTRHIYVYPKMTRPGDASSMAEVKVVSPGKVELVAVEYRPDDADWSLHLKPCKDVSLYFFHIKALGPVLRTAIGRMDDATSVELPGPFRAKPVSIPLEAGAFIGVARSFDIGLHDFRMTPLAFANPARYAVDFSTLFAAFPAIAADPIAATVAPRIVPQALYNRCPIDYFAVRVRAAMTALLADYDGIPLASGTPRCHSHMQDVSGRAQGNWWPDTEPTHDALFEEERTIALVNWNVDPRVQLFSFNENTPGLDPSLLEAGAPADDVNSAFEFPVRGSGRVNRKFADVTAGAPYCYELLRVLGGGRRLEAVVLIEVTAGPGGRAAQLWFQIVRAPSCAALPLPWSFGRGSVKFFR